jgi:hypothetical protein
MTANQIHPNRQPRPRHDYGAGTIELDPVLLHMEADDKLLERISKQLNQISAD